MPFPEGGGGAASYLLSDVNYDLTLNPDYHIRFTDNSPASGYEVPEPTRVKLGSIHLSWD